MAAEPVMAITSSEVAARSDDPVDRLRELGFRRTLAVDEGASIARRVGKTVRCGIYVLEFSNDEWYVGQAVDVTRRFLDHRRTYSDIVRVHFQRVRRKRLDEVERETIAELERHGWTLRNTALASYPRGASLLDEILDPDVLTEWCNSVDATVGDGPRKPLDSHRAKHRHKYERFTSLPHADRVIRVLRAYARAAIPAPNTTEMDFWSVTCLPSGGSNDVLARVNMHWQESFAVGVSPGPFGDYLWASFQVARSGLPTGLWNRLLFRARHPLLTPTRHRYVSGGSDQARLYLIGEKAILRLLQDAEAVSAIRTMNIRLMRKGRCNAAASHCMDLADRMLGETDS